MKQVLARAIVVGAVVLGAAACSGGEPSSQPSHEVSNRVVSPSKPEGSSTEERYRALMELELKSALSSESAILHQVRSFGTCAGRYMALGETDNIPDKEGLKAHVGNFMRVGAFFATEYAKRGPSAGVSQTRLAATLATLEKAKSDAESSTRALIEEGLTGSDSFELTVACKKKVLLMVKVLCFNQPTSSKNTVCLKN